jgi:chorismate mutase
MSRIWLFSCCQFGRLIYSKFSKEREAAVIARRSAWLKEKGYDDDRFVVKIFEELFWKSRALQLEDWPA